MSTFTVISTAYKESHIAERFISHYKELGADIHVGFNYPDDVEMICKDNGIQTYHYPGKSQTGIINLIYEAIKDNYPQDQYFLACDFDEFLGPCPDFGGDVTLFKPIEVYPAHLSYGNAQLELVDGQVGPLVWELDQCPGYALFTVFDVMSVCGSDMSVNEATSRLVKIEDWTNLHTLKARHGNGKLELASLHKNVFDSHPEGKYAAKKAFLDRGATFDYHTTIGPLPQLYVSGENIYHFYINHYDQFFEKYHYIEGLTKLKRDNPHVQYLSLPPEQRVAFLKQLRTRFDLQFTETLGTYIEAVSLNILTKYIIKWYVCRRLCEMVDDGVLDMAQLKSETVSILSRFDSLPRQSTKIDNFLCKERG